MNVALWIAQAIVALVVTLAGMAKLALSREQLAPKMHWAATWPRWRIKLLGLAEVAGGIGLVLPMATGIAPALTPVAALCLAMLMAGAVQTHRRLHESFLPPAVILVLCVGIATGRFHSLRAEGSRAQRALFDAVAPTSSPAPFARTGNAFALPAHNWRG